MSKISYPQLVKDVADAVRTGTKTTDLIPAGELADTILAVLSRNPSSGDVTNVGDIKFVKYNDDDTITLIDKDNIEHTMVCNYQNSKLVSIDYDGEYFEFTYNTENLLIRIGETEFNLENIPEPRGSSVEVRARSSIESVLSPVHFTTLSVPILGTVQAECSISLEE